MTLRCKININEKIPLYEDDNCKVISSYKHIQLTKDKYYHIIKESENIYRGYHIVKIIGDNTELIHMHYFGKNKIRFDRLGDDIYSYLERTLYDYFYTNSEDRVLKIKKILNGS